MNSKDTRIAPEFFQSTIIANGIRLLAGVLFLAFFDSSTALCQGTPRSISMWSDVTTDGDQNGDPSNDYTPDTAYVVGIGCTETDYSNSPEYDYWVETTVSGPGGSSETLYSWPDPYCSRADVYLPLQAEEGTYNVDSEHYKASVYGGPEQYLGCTHEAAAAAKMEVYYGYRSSYPNPFSGGTICVYQKCAVADCGATTLEEWVGAGQPCPAGVMHVYRKFILCWHGEHYHFPTFNPCP
jgi:hypothetical protein